MILRPLGIVSGFLRSLGRFFRLARGRLLHSDALSEGLALHVRSGLELLRPCRLHTSGGRGGSTACVVALGIVRGCVSILVAARKGAFPGNGVFHEF